jgi:hypothetical protein
VTDLLAQVLAIAGRTERYCIASGRPVAHVGDRCRSHGAAATMCNTDVRPARCEHPHLSPNHPYPCCEECGRDLRTSPPTEPTN